MLMLNVINTIHEPVRDQYCMVVSYNILRDWSVEWGDLDLRVQLD